ncbi:Fungal Zn(2)-Cys(6) binuclear cluster domain [Ceratobasidium sp. AG-Ba]|nr:Fungal Zn(2)-Cys(6) binuclear cluster domain [Ceratobasidium sp. AG-Ba]
MSSTGPARNTASSNRQNPLVMSALSVFSMALTTLLAFPQFRGAGCHHCRSRKVKCDAGKPHCSRCVEQGTTDKCVYDEIRKSKLTLQKEENAALKERIARLERQLAAQGSGQPEPDDPPTTDFTHLHVDERDDADDDDQDDPQQPGPYPPLAPQAPHVDTSNVPAQPLAPAWSIDSAMDALQAPTLPTGLAGPIPYWDPNTMPASPNSGASPFRGALASYDAYLGAPNSSASASVRNRPIPSPPVFGVDVVMNFFQHWKNESAATYRRFTNSAAGYSESTPSSGMALVGNWWECDDLPTHQRDYLYTVFRPFRKQVGLEIWVPDFLASLHNLPKGRPHPGLMWMIYTFAAQFSGEPELEALIPEFLERARRCLRRGHSEGDRLFNCVQGMTLLATMLYLQGKINEGNLEANTACHVAMTCGLHKISSSDWFKPAAPPPRSGLRIRQVDYHLAPPASAREHGERIAAFWQLVLVDHTAAATTGLPANFRDDGDQRSRVETVFPRPLEDYVNGKASGAPYATLGDIFAPRFIPVDPPDIVTTLQVKATALLERAVRLGTMWRDGVDLSYADPDRYRAEYNIVYTAIRHFRSYLPPIRQPADEPQLPCTSNGLVWERLYPHFITLNAEIQLFYVLGDTDSLAYDRCLVSARAVESMIAQLTDAEISQIGVMFGHCFTSALHVLQREMRTRKALGDQVGVDIVTREQEVVLNALAVLGKEHHLVAVQSARARRSVASEGGN